MAVKRTLRLYLRERARGAVHVVPGVIHYVGMELESGREGGDVLGIVVAVMVERVERSALYLLAIGKPKEQVGASMWSERKISTEVWYARRRDSKRSVPISTRRDGTVWGLNNHNGTILLGKWGPGGRA